MKPAASLRILVIDDDLRTARLLVRLLCEDGFEAEAATSSHEASARLARPPAPEVALVDLRVPSIENLAIVHHMRATMNEMPIFVLTNYPHRVETLMSAEAAPPVVLPKPLDYEALGAALRELAAARTAA